MIMNWSTGNSLCPVAAVVAYMVIRGNSTGPFFCFMDSKPLTKARFTEVICKFLEAVGHPQDHFAGHSFRIGVATIPGC